MDGYAFPLKCTGGLMYLSILDKPTDEELVKYPSVHLTSIHEWNPEVLDYSHPEGDGEPLQVIDPQHRDLLDPNFDTYGMYTKRANITLSSLADAQQLLPMALPSPLASTHVNQYHVKSETPDYTNSPWGVRTETIPMRRHLKSRNPALNVPHRHEAVATDTVYSDTPAVDSGVKPAQLFVGKESLVSNIYPMRSDNHFVNTLEDNIHRHSALDKLISESAKNEISHMLKSKSDKDRQTDCRAEI